MERTWEALVFWLNFEMIEWPQFRSSPSADKSASAGFFIHAPKQMESINLSFSKRFFHPLALALLLGLASGCQSKAWYREGATEAEFNSDLAESTMRASIAVGPVPVTPPAAGMTGAVMSGISHGLRRNELVKQYMLEKGWRLVPKTSD